MSLALPLLLLACTGSVRTPGHDTSGDDTADTGTDTGDTAAPGDLLLPAEVALPFVEVGDPAPSASVVLTAPDGAGALTLATSGPFAVTGDTAAVPAGASRTLTVALTGGTGAIRLVDGLLSVTADGHTHEVALSAVVARPDLPAATWTVEGHLHTTTVALPTAPYPVAGGAWTDPSVLVAVPEGMRADGRPGVVTHLHGHNALLATTVPAQHLLEQADLAGRDAVVIVPQGPVQAASGDFGKLMDPGGHAALVDDVLALAWRDGLLHSPVPGTQVLTSHSGGYLATAAILQDGGYPVDAAHLFDSVYAQEAAFAAFAEDGGVLRSSYTDGGGTIDDNAQLAGLLDAASVPWAATFDDPTLHGVDVVIGYSPATHNGCIWQGREWARWLVESGLRPNDDAPPELLATTAVAGTADVTWRIDRGSAGRRVRVEGSDDGVAFTTLGEGVGGSLAVDAHPWLRAVGIGLDGTISRPSDVYGATGGDWLVVDGFDRVLDGSWREETHPFAARVGAALDASFSVASNEAVAQGLVDLSETDRVLWLLGDESTGDVTFDADERAAVDAYLAGGGRLVASGSEIAWATPPDWLESALHAVLVADDAGTTSAGGYTFGVTYEEDWPDVLSGDTVLWSYATGGAAAVGWDHRVVVVGFPLETLADEDLAPALADLSAWLD